MDQRNLERLPKRWDLEEVCNRIAAGESLAQIAQSYAKSKQALWKYLNTDEERRKRYLESLEAKGILHLEASERIAHEVETRVGCSCRYCCFPGAELGSRSVESENA